MVPLSGLNLDCKVHFAFPEARNEVPLQIESLGYNPDQENILRTQGHRLFHWIQTVEGRGLVTIGARKFLLEPNQGVMFVPGLPHSYRADGGPWSTAYLTFSGPLVDSLMTTLGLKFSARYRWAATNPFSGQLVKDISQWRQGHWGSEWERSELVYRFLVQWRAQCHLDESLPAAALQHRLTPLFQLIEKRMDDPAFGVNDMADFLHVSARHLTELFRRVCQTSPYHHLRALRLNQARLILLNEPGTGIKEVASRVGFRDPSHFILAFRQAMGQSPDQYRKSVTLAS